jgi:hypothetical protein
VAWIRSKSFGSLPPVACVKARPTEGRDESFRTAKPSVAGGAGGRRRGSAPPACTAGGPDSFRRQSICTYRLRDAHDSRAPSALPSRRGEGGARAADVLLHRAALRPAQPPAVAEHRQALAAAGGGPCSTGSACPTDTTSTTAPARSTWPPSWPRRPASAAGWSAAISPRHAAGHGPDKRSGLPVDPSARTRSRSLRRRVLRRRDRRLRRPQPGRPGRGLREMARVLRSPARGWWSSSSPPRTGSPSARSTSSTSCACCRSSAGCLEARLRLQLPAGVGAPLPGAAGAGRKDGARGLPRRRLEALTGGIAALHWGVRHDEGTARPFASTGAALLLHHLLRRLGGAADRRLVAARPRGRAVSRCGRSGSRRATSTRSASTRSASRAAC